MFTWFKEIKRSMGVPRSPKWSGLRDKTVKEKPSCAACGKTENLTVHHCIPFHIDPSKELDESNLIVLCESKTMNCHYMFGHLGRSWSGFNPNVREDAEKILAIFSRPTQDKITEEVIMDGNTPDSNDNRNDSEGGSTEQIHSGA